MNDVRFISVRGNQRGVALLIALMILVIISLMGISAMRTSLFNAKIAASAQGGTMAFQAAESAIAAVYEEARNGNTADPTNVIGAAMASYGAAGTTEIQYRCVEASDINTKAQCGSSDFMDSRDLVKASSRTLLTGVRQDTTGGSQISTTGSSTIAYGYYDFLTVAEGSVPAFNIKNYNAQEFTKLGPLDTNL